MKLERQMNVIEYHRELHAKAFALDKARQVSGEIVQAVLDKTQVAISETAKIEEAEEYIERRIAGLLKQSVIEFADLYTADLERRLDEMNRVADDALNLKTRPEHN